MEEEYGRRRGEQGVNGSGERLQDSRRTGKANCIKINITRHRYLDGDFDIGVPAALFF